MKRYLIAVVIAASGLALTLDAAAQGRHDEKPHATAKASSDPANGRAASTGGRHDSGPTTHGAPKAAAAKGKAGSGKGSDTK